MFNEIRSNISKAWKFATGKVPKAYGTATVMEENPRLIYDLFTEEFSNLTSANVKNYIEYARKGFPAYMYWLFDTILQRDLRFGSTVRRRKLSVIDEKYEIQCEWEEGKEFAEMILNKLGDSRFSIYRSMVEGNYKGIKMFEVNWISEGGKWIPYDVQGISNHLYLYDDRKDEYSVMDIKNVTGNDLINYGAVGVMDRIPIEAIPKVDIPPDKLIVLKSIEGNVKNSFMNGLTIGFILAFFCKNYNVKDLQMYIEKFANPTVDAEYDPLNVATKTEMVTAVQNFKAHGSIVHPAGTLFKLLNDESKGATSDIFMRSINYWDISATIAALGESETTELGEQGSLAALKEIKKVSNDYHIADMKLISIGFNELFKKAFDLNFATVQEYPVMQFVKVKTLEDKKSQSEIYRNLNDIGYKVSKEVIEEQQDIEVEETSTKEPDDTNKNDDNKDDKKKTEASEFAEKKTVDEITDEYIKSLFNK